jgi:hypothetical protein
VLVHGHTRHHHSYISQKVSELARLLLCMRQHYKHIHNLTQCIHPSQFSNVVFCVRDVAGFNTTNKTCAKPTLALRLGHSVKACSMELGSQAMICDDQVLK